MKKIIYFCLFTSLFLTYPMYSIEAATYEYDELGRVTQATNEDGSLVTYVYDANGNLVEIKTETAIGKTSGADRPSEEATGEGRITTQSATDITLQDDVKLSVNDNTDNTSVISDETVSANHPDDFVDEEQEDDKALDLVKEEMEKQEETEAESKKNSLLLALLVAGATGGIVILLWKKLSKSKDEDGEGNVNE